MDAEFSTRRDLAKRLRSIYERYLDRANFLFHARFNRMKGKDVFFLTGTDEHGQKIAQKAAEAGMQPKPFIDGLVDKLKEIWKVMVISYDKFIRTTDEEHVLSVQKIFEKLY